MSNTPATEHKGIIAWWARNSVAANLLMLLAIGLGIWGFLRLEREVFPQADFNGASVSISWPGASPSDVEEQIVTRLEEVMADLDGLKRMSGVARESVGYVNLETYNNYDLQKFLDEVKLRVDTLNNLPQASFPPQVQRWRNEQMYFGIAVHGDADRMTLKRITDDIRDDIAALEGGELAQVWGTLDEEVSIEVSEDALRRYGLTFSDVANAIRRSSVNSSGGSIKTDVGGIRLNVRELADTKEQFGEIIVRQLPSGATIRVKDVATVIDGFVDADLETTYDGDPTAFVMVMAPETMNIPEYSKRLHNYLDEVNKELPEAIKADVLFDMSRMFTGQMNTIQGSALLGTFLVLLVLILFLRPVVAFWVTIGIATAFAGGFALLPYFGVSLNTLSFFAVLLVIGVIVDDAIVVGENIHKEVESGRRDGVDAAIVGTQLVVKPIIFGVLTTMIMFAPWALLPTAERQFTAQITYVVVAALGFSLIESMFILPAHLKHMHKQEFDGRQGVFLKFQRRIADSLVWFAENLFKPVLELAIRFRYVTVAFFLATFLLAGGLILTKHLPVAMMPEIDDDLVQVTIELPDGTPFSRTQEVRDQLYAGYRSAQKVMKERYPDWDQGEFITDASIIANDRRVQAFIGTMLPEERPDGLRTKHMADVIRDETGPIPDAEEVRFAFTVNQNEGGYRVALSHNDLDYLREAADMVKAQLATYESTYDIGDNLSSAAPELRFSLKPGAEALGVSLATISQQVRQAYYGEEVQRLPRDGEDVRVMVRYPEDARTSLDSLEDLRIRTADGRAIPLSQVADIEFAPGINRIYRRDRTRSVAIFSELNGDVRGQITADMEKNFWPKFEERFPDIKRGALGNQEAENEFLTNIVNLNIAALVFMYVLLAIAFKSYFQPLLLMMAVPFSFAGAMFGHFLFGIPVAMFSVFGIAAAAGVVINDNLVLIDNVNRRRFEHGEGAVQALVESAVSRFRPILLTSVTTFVGVLPMIAEKSVQAQFMKPMVVAMGSAVAFALFVSLLMVPALYAVGAELARFFRWMWSGEPFRPIGETYHSEDVPGIYSKDDHLQIEGTPAE